MKCLFKGCRGHNKDGECGAGVDSGCKDFIPESEQGATAPVESPPAGSAFYPGEKKSEK